MSNIIQKIRDIQRIGNHIPPMDVEVAEPHKCLNCDTEFKGNYCPNCGQKAGVGRLRIRNTIVNFLGLFTKMNRGAVHTIVDLLYRPGFMMREYLDGHRAEYASPLLLVFLVITLNVILPYSSSVSTVYPEQWTTMLQDYPVSYWLTRAWVWLFEDDRRTYLFFGLLLTPAIWLTAKIVRAGKYSPNFAESFHMLLYIISLMLFLELIYNQTKWIPGIGYSIYHVMDHIMAFVVFPFIVFFSVWDCLKLNWKKMIVFMILAPLILYLCFNVMFLFINFVLQMDLPKDIYKQINLLYMINK